MKGGPNYYFLSDTEKYANGVRKAALMAKKLKEYKLGEFADAFLLRRYWLRQNQKTETIFKWLTALPMFKYAFGVEYTT